MQPSELQVGEDEIRAVMQSSSTSIRRQERGKIVGEHLYGAYGRTDAGRYLSVFLFTRRLKQLLSSARAKWTKKKEDVMPKRKSLPNVTSYKEANDWLDTHSTAELYANPVRFEVASGLRMVIVDSQDNPIETLSLKRQMSRQIRQIARQEGISPELLVQNWLREKIEQRQVTK